MPDEESLDMVAVRFVGVVLVTAALALPARAEMIGTPELLAPSVEAQHASVDTFLAREDVKRRMVELGVGPDAAASRVASLTAAELQLLSSRIDSLPAGGHLSTLEVLLIVILLVVLLV